LCHKCSSSLLTQPVATHSCRVHSHCEVYFLLQHWAGRLHELVFIVLITVCQSSPSCAAARPFHKHPGAVEPPPSCMWTACHNLRLQWGGGNSCLCVPLCSFSSVSADVTAAHTIYWCVRFNEIMLQFHEGYRHTSVIQHMANFILIFRHIFSCSTLNKIPSTFKHPVLECYMHSVLCEIFGGKMIPFKHIHLKEHKTFRNYRVYFRVVSSGRVWI
jgi:hypothetical protein